MSELQVITAAQSIRIKRIKTYHTGFHKAYGQQMGYAFLAGVELNATKAELPHGQFEKFLTANLPDISKGARHRYMLFAETLQTKFPTVGNLELNKVKVTKAGLPKGELTKVLEAVHEIADGKTLTELYRDLGVIRPPKKQKYTPPQLTDAQAVESELETANQELILAAQILNGLCDGVALSKASDEARSQLNEARLNFNKVCQPLFAAPARHKGDRTAIKCSPNGLPLANAN